MDEGTIWDAPSRARMNRVLAPPHREPPAGKKWWWRPFYCTATMTAKSVTQSCRCAFCGKSYDLGIPSECECGAQVAAGRDGQWGLVPESHNTPEMWM
jgi:hypothetical protein